MGRSSPRGRSLLVPGWQEEKGFFVCLCYSSAQEAAELVNNTRGIESCFKDKIKRGVRFKPLHTSFHHISYLNRHLVLVYYFSFPIKVFWYPLAHMLKKKKSVNSWGLSRWPGLFCWAVFPEMCWVLLSALKHHGKSHQHRAMFKWPGVKWSSGNQTLRLNILLPKLKKWKIFYERLFSTHNMFSFSIFLPLFLPCSLFCLSFLFSSFLNPVYAVCFVPAFSWLLLANDGTNALFVPLETEEGKIKI